MIANVLNPLKKHEDDLNKLFYKEEKVLIDYNKINKLNYKESRLVLVSLMKELKQKTI